MPDNVSPQILRTGFKANFNTALKAPGYVKDSFSTELKSSTAIERYDWLLDMPRVRTWVQDSQYDALKAETYTVENSKWETKFSVSIDDIEDAKETNDIFGKYGPLATAAGQSFPQHFDELCAEALSKGFERPCYDGQNFFDVEHPGVNEDGVDVSVSNMKDGTLPPWFLVDQSQPIKPIIFQMRKAPELWARDNPKDKNVTDKQAYEYGAIARYATGYAFWQTAFGSKEALTDANFKAARLAMAKFKDSRGRPLAVRPTAIVVGPSNEDMARELFERNFNANGAANPLSGAVKIIVCPYLD